MDGPTDLTKNAGAQQLNSHGTALSADEDDDERSSPLPWMCLAPALRSTSARIVPRIVLSLTTVPLKRRTRWAAAREMENEAWTYCSAHPFKGNHRDESWF